MGTDLVVRLTEQGTAEATFGDRLWPCAIGPAGLVVDKTEGDSATPIGRFPLRRVLYRADRLPPPETALPSTAIGEDDGWCDDRGDPRYNRPVRRPYPARHERLWREDGVYDLVVVLGHNDDPPVPGRGSAVFLHIARPDYAPTEGCVALSRDHLLTFLRLAGADAAVRVEGGSP